MVSGLVFMDGRLLWISDVPSDPLVRRTLYLLLFYQQRADVRGDPLALAQ